MAGYGYVDERGEYALEGYSVVLRGVGGAFELVSTSLLSPGLTDEPRVAQVARNLGRREAFSRLAPHPPSRPVIRST